MKIFVAQIKSIVGDFTHNFKRIKEAYDKAIKSNADICLFPELVTCGYLAEDLFLDQDFIEQTAQINNNLIESSGQCALILPTMIKENKNNSLYNGVIVAQNGKILGKTYKRFLPNYGLFDEKRYFIPGKSQIIKINDRKIGIPICEDIWHKEVCNDLKQQGAELFLVPNASPYHVGKFGLRQRQIEARYKEHNIPFIFCNQSHSQDGIIFDGQSFCYDGALSIVCNKFTQDDAIVAFEENGFKCNRKKSVKNIDAEIYEATKFALKTYVQDNGFEKVILGLSGGIDSAIVATICASSIGGKNVTAYMMPSNFTSVESIDDAKILAKQLSIKLITIPINKILDEYVNSMSAQPSKKNQDLMYQNLQARIRGTMLMAEANKNNALLITTGNKSEYATGYATIYGDMNGAFNPIKDIYKTQIFALAKYINSISQIIPQNIIDKAPSAELAENQKDSDSLPEYKILDQILYQYIECNMPKKELYKNFEPAIVDKIIKLVKISEFKRRQSAPGVKISIRNFEKERRFPITNLF